MYQAVIDFWFEEIDKKQWWTKDSDFDELIRVRFSAIHNQASNNELFDWRSSPEGSLAEIIILDQFSRNMYRDTPQSFAYDALALALSQHAISKQFDAQLTTEKRSFLYMPFMHSESSLIHKEAVKLFEILGSPQNLAFEHKHKIIIDRFGRYPHRNAILGRESTEEEIEFLKQPNSGF